MRFRLTIILAVLNALVFGSIFYLEGLEEEDDSVRRNAPILDAAIREATSIEIGGEALDTPRQLELDASGNWVVTRPVHWWANRHAVEQALESLLFLREQIRFSLEDI